MEECISMTDSDDRLISAIQRVRAKNNILWMDVVRLAMRLARKKARAIFKKIEANDRKITELIRRTYGDKS